MARFGLDWLFVRRLWVFIQVLYPSWTCPSVWMTAFVLISSILDQFLTYFVGILPSEFYVVLGSRDLNTFPLLAAKSVLFILAKSLCLTAMSYATSLLYLRWRRTACYKLHSLYFSRLAFYKINALGDNIDNPDQRMTQDVDKATKILATEILAPVLLAPFIIAYYTYKTYDSSGILGPVAIFLYFLCGSIINKLLLTPIVRLVVAQERKEGDFRFKHLAIRSHAEAMAFYQAEATENELTNVKLDRLLKTQHRLVNRQFPLKLSTNTFDYFGGILSYFIMAMPVFVLHAYDDIPAVEITGVVSRNAFFYMYLINCFSKLIDLSAHIGDLAGTTHRVVELLEELRRSHDDKLETEPPLTAVVSGGGRDPPPPPPPESRERRSLIPSDLGAPTDGAAKDSPLALELIDATYCLPDDPSCTALASSLSLQIMRGRNVLISGSSSSGKTSVLRVLAGLWQLASGRVYVRWPFTPSRLLFLPQKPYFPNGGASLKQQIIYPKLQSEEEDEAKITEVLRIVKLEHLITRCEELDSPIEWSWQETLSPGELQRLSLARAFYHEPQIVFLDEATSAIGINLERELYLAFQERGMTCVSVGHRTTLKCFHDVELSLDGHGGWTLQDIDHEALSVASLASIR